MGRVSVSLDDKLKSFIASARNYGYTVETAVGDIIDNSIDANATKINILSGLKDKYDDMFVAFLDNGKGMTEQELINAMFFVSKDPRDKRSDTELGRFGQGLKTASLSQCKTFTVATKKEGILRAARFSYDKMMTSDKPYVDLLDQSQIQKLPNVGKFDSLESGTMVIWNDLDILLRPYPSESEALKDFYSKIEKYLSRTYHLFIDENLSISFNDQSPLTSDNPFTQTVSANSPQYLETNTPNKALKFEPYLKYNLENQKLINTKEQGFYVYRNKRLIMEATWFGLSKKFKRTRRLRVRVEIPNTADEEWSLDIKKSSVVPPVKFNETIKKFLENWKKLCEDNNKQAVEKLIEQDKNKGAAWIPSLDGNDAVIFKIDRNIPEIRSILSKNPELETCISSLLTRIENELPNRKRDINTIDNDDISISGKLATEQLNDLKKSFDSYKNKGHSKEELYGLLDTDTCSFYFSELAAYIEEIYRV